MNDNALSADAWDAGTLYRLFTGSIAPRPIAWVSSADAASTANLAPFSFFNVASVAPPVLVFSPLLNGQAEAKDTLNNLTAVPECVIHIGGEVLAEALNVTSASLAPEQDEFEHAGLAKVAMPPLQVPRIAEAPVAFGCRVRDIMRFGEGPMAGNLVIAEVVAIHADPAVWNGRHVDLDVLKPIGRLAGSDYLRASDRFALSRPT
ncbi:flavin reductase family protein [Halomonas sp. ML-15]|uniref:flavin reductase family protein n=1 Tax=Halomonas sp. ML-15 TaxID=2773305 RepID=UPI0017476FF3|nr:flavin reductase family protein [Halomonas sp. ML-15]MBD3896698.1 flavin reductase family protein [Halomonas sp. ML-15]